LYRPFGKNPDILKDELLRRNSKLMEWYYLRLLNVNLVAGKPIAEGVSVLEGFDYAKTSAVLTEKLGDLYSAQGKPSSAAHAYREALQLKPSPQQRIRLLLTLGDKLTSLDQNEEAYTLFQQFLREYLDYPDKGAIYKRLLPLAKKLDKKSDAESYQAALTPKAPAGR
jgi:tetratricopeptide (TPR) repeat protein